MNVSPAKENILKRIRHALSQPVQLPFPSAEGNSSVYAQEGEGLEIRFAEEFTKLQGKFVFCADQEELVENIKTLAGNMHWKNLHCREPHLTGMMNEASLPFLNVPPGLDEADAGITACELLIARTGSIVVSAAQPSGRAVPVFPPVHIVVAYVDQLVFDIKEGISRLRGKYGDRLPSMISFQSGPSRTADIEKTLVVGVHGPKEVYVFLVDAPAPAPNPFT